MVAMSGERTCSHCGASMQEGQDWCLQCGAGAPGGSPTGPGWRSAAAVLGATGVLVLGAAAAAYAALQQGTPAKPPVPVAQTPATTTTTTTTATTSTPPPVTTPTQTPDAKSPSLNTPTTPPKIPRSTSTPGSTKSTTTSTSTTSSSTTTTSTSNKTSSTSQPVLLDTNASQIYNPSNFPASRFGDPSLAIDGDTTTAWTVQLEASEAPSVGAGLTLNLNAPLKIAQITLITETTGITVQIYGTKSSKVPQSLHSEEWVPLSHAHLVQKRKATIKLMEASKSFRQLLVWIIKAPTSTTGQFTGTEAAINEIQLYETSGSGSQG
jgi:hypothetical protein